MNYPTGRGDEGIVAGDFNGDNKLDLVTANLDADTVSVLLGNGDGTFKTHVDYATGSNPVSVIAGDFNADGKLDLAVANASSSTLSILLGNGDGTFQSHVDYATGAAPTGIIVGDFNHDGKLDLATSNYLANTVSILIGNGDGTFQSHVDYAVGVEPGFLTSADFNGDGEPDLAVVNTNCQFGVQDCDPGSVSVLFGNGDGTFQSHVDYALGVAPFGPAAADFNGDGGVDLAVANTFSNTVSILLNLPVISTFPKSLNFGNEIVGKTSQPRTVTISNPSGTPFTISTIRVAGFDASDFAQTNNCPAKLAPGAQCTISVTFTPRIKGKRSADVRLSDSVPGSPQFISLTGKGT